MTWKCILQISLSSVISFFLTLEAAYLPSLYTNEFQVRFPVPALLCIWFPVQICFRRFFSGHSSFPPASKTGPKRSKTWSESPPEKQWHTLSEATLSKYGISYFNFRVLLRVRLLYYLKQEVIGEVVEQIEQGVHVRWVYTPTFLTSYMILQ